jgi:hypothetical protein
MFRLQEFRTRTRTRTRTLIPRSPRRPRDDSVAGGLPQSRPCSFGWSARRTSVRELQFTRERRAEGLGRSCTPRCNARAWSGTQPASEMTKIAHAVAWTRQSNAGRTSLRVPHRLRAGA